ncbi:AlpA family phage regulatory protein [Escherichia coli]|nr:AlpA family phage regulatory protein [Escherichia coli]EJL1356955.1 AlpA family phage regulatory protein [Escherichia coli]
MRAILLRPEVKALLRIKSDSTLTEMINKGGFPKGFRIGLRRIGWYEDEVLAWLKERERNSRSVSVINARLITIKQQDN